MTGTSETGNWTQSPWRAAVSLRRSRRARRVGLRVRPEAGLVELVVPHGVSERAALRFAESRADWILGQVRALPPRIPFEHGAVLPVLGAELALVHDPSARHGVRRHEDRLVVAGAAEHLRRRVTDWLRGEARRTISPAVRGLAARLDRTVRSVSIRDPRTRWGSCAPDGRMSFSWRLLLAPPAVLDYVVAHEAAHLLEAGHGPRFWALVEELMPPYREPAAWLRRHGDRLHRYG